MLARTTTFIENIDGGLKSLCYNRGTTKLYLWKVPNFSKFQNSVKFRKLESNSKILQWIRITNLSVFFNVNFFLVLQFFYIQRNNFITKSSKIGEGVEITEEITNSCYKNVKSELLNFNKSDTASKIKNPRTIGNLIELLKCHDNERQSLKSSW